VLTQIADYQRDATTPNSTTMSTGMDYASATATVVVRRLPAPRLPVVRG
jgi:hypothetical protein